MLVKPADAVRLTPGVPPPTAHKNVMDAALRGDVLADEDYGQTPTDSGVIGPVMLSVRPPTASKPSTPASPRLTALRTPTSQANSFAARRRLEQLQFGGIAQANNGGGSSAGTSAAASPVARTLASSGGAFSSSNFGSISIGGGGSGEWWSSGSIGGGSGMGNSSGGGGGGGIVPVTSATAAALVVGTSDPQQQQQQHGTEAERQLAAYGLSHVYDPTGGVAKVAAAAAAAVAPLSSSANGSPSGGGARAQLPPPARVRFTDGAAFLLEPGPRDRTVQCVVVREKDGVAGGKSHRYQLFLDDPDGGPRRFVAAARRRRGRAASVYDITSSPAAGGAARYAPGFAGKLRANFLGTEFLLTDAGAKPGAAGKPTSGGSSGAAVAAGGATATSLSGAQPAPTAPLRRELAAVSYVPNVLGAKGPRRMLVVAPAIAPPAGSAGAERGATSSSSSSNGGGGIGIASHGPLLGRLKEVAAATAACAGADNTANQQQQQQEQQQQPQQQQQKRPPPPADLVVLRNKAPRWNETLGAYCLNFGGRVTVASVKNFQLVADCSGDSGGAEDAIVMQFGKASGDTFTCDFRWPLCALQAFALCLSSFDGKLACE